MATAEPGQKPTSQSPTNGPPNLPTTGPDLKQGTSVQCTAENLAEHVGVKHGVRNFARFAVLTLVRCGETSTNFRGSRTNQHRFVLNPVGIELAGQDLSQGDFFGNWIGGAIAKQGLIPLHI